jgi:TonB family protein
MRGGHLLWIGVIGLLIGATGSDTAGLSRTAGPRPQGTSPSQAQPIRAKDGDTILIEGDARIRIVRRRSAVIRTVHNLEKRTLIVLVDYASDAAPADGIVDMTYNFRQLSDGWPIEERWDGSATVEEYTSVGRPGYGYGYGFQLPQGLVQLLNSPDAAERNPEALAVLTYTTFGSGGGNRLAFDAAEQRAMNETFRDAGVRAVVPSNTGVSVSSGSGSTASSSSGVAAGVRLQPGASSDAPVRVGGNVPPPRKIRDAAAVTPRAARDAGVFGTVILEITIDPEGAVRDARVLRSIPLLDAAALDAVRQWRYEPTMLNDRPVSVVVTVPITFVE